MSNESKEFNVYFSMDGYEVATVVNHHNEDESDMIYTLARSKLINKGVNLDNAIEGDIVEL